MTPKERERYKIWLRQANFDLRAAQLSLEGGYYEWATYQAEQAVEKSLKACILHSGEKPPKIHKLSVLFGYCNNLNETFKNTKFHFRYIESFAFISRYPFLIPGKESTPHDQINKQEAEKALEEANDILKKVEGILKSEPFKATEKLPSAISKEQLSTRLETVRTALIQEFSPEKIIVFGSYARDPLPSKLSTIDILVIAETDMAFTERIIKAREVTKGGIPSIEPLIYTSEEFKIMTSVEGESFFESALEEGRVIFEKRK